MRIKLKRSNTPSDAPTTSDIEEGEVTLNMADQIIHYRDASNNIKQIVHGPANELVATGATIDTINANTGTIVEVESGSFLHTNGMQNTATTGPERAIFIRNSYFGAIDVGRDGQGNLASGQTGGSIQFRVAGDDGNAYGGIIYTDYDTTNGNGFFVDVFDDGVSTFTSKTAIEARADSFKVLEGDLEFTTDSTDQTITPSGRLLTTRLRNDATSGGDIAVFTRNVEAFASNHQHVKSSTLADGDKTAAVGFSITDGSTTAFPAFIQADYDSVNGNSIFLQTYDDSVSTFTTQTVMEARADRVRMMEADLTFTTDGTDQTITGTGDIKFGSVIQLEQIGADPGTATNGSMYYNTATHKFRGYANGSWIDLH